MHIKIEDDENKIEAVLCIERGHNIARILYSERENIRTLTNIAQSLGAGMVLVEVEPEEVEEFESLGFERVTFYVAMRKLF